jgi:hypothetical protein
LRFKYWVIGIVTAGLGLLLVRVIASSITQLTPKLVAYFSGVTLALAGLAIIAFGISRHAK